MRIIGVIDMLGGRAVHARAGARDRYAPVQTAAGWPIDPGNVQTLAAGADVHSKDSYNGTGLIRAADRGHVEIIEELLKTDIEIDHINRLGWTALLEAIILGDGGARHTEVVRQLVEAGADVNLADGQGVTPLVHARQRGYAEIAGILRGAGAH